MKFIGNNFKNSLFLALFTLFLFTGCSQKSYDVDYDKFYKDTKNSKINNSKEMLGMDRIFMIKRLQMVKLTICMI